MNFSKVILLNLIVPTVVLVLASELYEYPKSDALEEYYKRRIGKKNHINIFSNHPDEKDIVQNYFDGTKGYDDSQEKIYIKLNASSNKDDDYFYDHNGHKYGRKHSNRDELHSDFGFFEPEDTQDKIHLSPNELLNLLSDRYSKRNHTPYYTIGLPPRRPNFKTKKPEPEGGSILKDKNDIYQLNDLLKKQLVKIQKFSNINQLKISNTIDPIGLNQSPEVLEYDDEPPNNEKGQVIDQPGSKFFVPLTGIKNKTIKLANKFLSLFTIIQFPNSRCQATSASSIYEGNCYHRIECLKRNGTAMGFCANGYGVCCVDRQSCGGVSGNNCTYFESPGYPNYFPMNGTILIPSTTTTTPSPGLTPDPRIKYFEYGRQEDVSLSLSCTFRVLKATPGVTLMRIDFLDLELQGPTNGTCIDERLIISGQNVNTQVPVICGYNTGQHVYVDVSSMIGPLQISILSTTVDRKRHRIRICQYEGTCEGSMNCLQYYTGVQGTISSFNYEQSATFNRSVPGYFNNLNYAICIRREAGYCSITYTNEQNNIEYPFELINILANGVPTVPEGQAGAEIFNCPSDYIVINGIRLCGYKLNDGSVQDNFRLNAPVTDTSAGPIVIPVRTDTANATGRGFKLFYTQNRCT